MTCGATSKLEVDHIDPRTKTYRTSELWWFAEDRFWLEIRKCQLLCGYHHRIKSAREHGKDAARHGTYYMYRSYKCRCDPCRQAARMQRNGWLR